MKKAADLGLRLFEGCSGSVQMKPIRIAPRKRKTAPVVKIPTCCILASHPNWPRVWLRNHDFTN
jgi:hypothetical protein